VSDIQDNDSSLHSIDFIDCSVISNSETPESSRRQSLTFLRIHFKLFERRMNAWFDRVGYSVDIASLEHRWGIRMNRLDEFLRSQDWPKILGATITRDGSEGASGGKQS
jgi:hypothetical protein